MTELIRDKNGKLLFHGNKRYRDFYEYFHNVQKVVDYVPDFRRVLDDEYSYLFEPDCQLYLPREWRGLTFNSHRVYTTLHQHCKTLPYNVVHRTINTDYVLFKVKR